MTVALAVRSHFAAISLALVALVALTACGAKTGLREPDVVEVHDAAPDVSNACMPVEDQCGEVEVCGNGSDDNCNGVVDEGCGCTPGAVQPCFAAQPGRRHIGACRDGAQTCGTNGTWGACTGGILPGQDQCNGADNLCTGCSRQSHCPITCPSPDDTRVPDGRPFTDYALRGEDFYAGHARAWSWRVQGGPCDDVAPRTPSFQVFGWGARDATLFPRLSGDYTVTLTVTPDEGPPLTCSWVVHIAGPGLRVEMCYPESDHLDLDLFLHRPGNTEDWYQHDAPNVYTPSQNVCGWDNCEAHLRGTGTGFPPMEVDRANWGYADTPLENCEHGPYGREWTALGHCANPRLDLDNNLAEGVGVPENINIDNPRDGESFRIMVQNFTGWITHPLVNVYCGGRRLATYGAHPDEVPHFEGLPGRDAIGAMWRVADVTTRVDASGTTTGCDIVPLHPRGATSGYFVTNNDGTY